MKLTPEQREAQRQRIRAENQLAKKKEAERAVALRAKRKAQAEKKKELAALKRKRLAEKRKKLAEAKEKERRERKQRNGACIMVSCSFGISRSAVSVACASDHQAPWEAHERIRSVRQRNEETTSRSCCHMAKSLRRG